MPGRREVREPFRVTRPQGQRWALTPLTPDPSLSFPQSLWVPHARVPQRPRDRHRSPLPSELGRRYEGEARTSPDSPRLLSVRRPVHTPAGVQLCPRASLCLRAPVPTGLEAAAASQGSEGPTESLKPCPAFRECRGVLVLSSPLPFAGRGGGPGGGLGCTWLSPDSPSCRGRCQAGLCPLPPPGTLSPHLCCLAMSSGGVSASPFPACPAAPSRGCSRAFWPLAPTPSPCRVWVKRWTVWGSLTSPCAHGLQSPRWGWSLIHALMCSESFSTYFAGWSQRTDRLGDCRTA